MKKQVDDDVDHVTVRVLQTAPTEDMLDRYIKFREGYIESGWYHGGYNAPSSLHMLYAETRGFSFL